MPTVYNYEFSTKVLVVSPSAGQLPILTPAEAEVMRVLWSSGPSTVHEVVAALPRALAYTTTLTTLRILDRKGYVSRVPSPNGGRAHLFCAAVPATRARHQHTRDLVDRLFGGRAEDLVIALLEAEQVPTAELERLRALIDSKLERKKDK